ncbi:MAG TPA: DUF4388 domain-containing protein [Thermoanaerobaculia bacterium]|jgi:hypothetical protein|nr:DUF4388 domain-containing protein [Thermoanaerobaculia bacterium]
MGISGSLQDVSVADVMQFIHLGRRTGTLDLVRGRDRAMIGFHLGRLVSAQTPKTPKIGDLLVSSGLIARVDLDAAIREQRAAGPERRSLGQQLIESGSLSPESLRDVIARQIEQGVGEVLLWETGTFDFAIDDLRPIDDIAIYPSDVLPDGDINTQMVLLEAARIFDERSREPSSASSTFSSGATGSHPLVLGAGAGPAHASAAASHREIAVEALLDEELLLAAEIEVQIVCEDEVFLRRLLPVLARLGGRCRVAELAEVGRARPGDAPPIVVADLRRGALAPEQFRALSDSHPRPSLVALVDPETPVARVYGAGFLATLPAEVDAVAACVENLLESRREGASGGAAAPPKTPPREIRTGVARLRRVYGDLRSGLISATVALNLMHIISESVERAILFLVRRDQLVALGAFGVAADGKPLAERARGLLLQQLDMSDNALTRALESGEVQNVTFEAAALPDEVRQVLGPPRSGQVVVFPVLGAQRVISVIYADNGDRDQQIEDIDILELATAQVGMAFENELLRRQIQQKD